MEEEEEEEGRDETRKKKGSIRIPSFQDAAVRRDPTTSTSSAASFSQAFSFLKSSEFYSPPPPPSPPSPATDAAPPHASSPSAAPVGNHRNAILVSHRQKGNPLLKHIRNVRWVFADVVCDYLLGQSSCALYLSLRYHLLHPDYLYFRIRELQKNFKLRVVLCHIDVEDVVKPLLEVTRTALLHECTLLCGWSLEECGRYLETIKMYENKSADSIREQMDADYLSRLTHALTTVRRVNKTDVVTLGSNFGSLSRIMDASMEELARCPGIGERKVKRLYDAFHEPFRRVSARLTVVPEGPSEEQKTNEPPLSDETGIEKDTVGSRKGKEPEVDVRSALTAAFAKYADKVRKRDGKD